MPLLAPPQDIQGPEAQALAKFRQDPPAAVVQMNAQQLAELRGSDPVLTADIDAVRRANSPLIAKDAIDPNTHEPFGFNRAQEDVSEGLKPNSGSAVSGGWQIPVAPVEDLELPPALQKMENDFARQRAHDDARDLFVQKAREEMGEALPVSRGDIQAKLASSPPEEVQMRAREFVEQQLHYTNNHLPGVSQDMMASILRIREQANWSGSQLVGKNEAETARLVATHESAAKAYDSACLSYLKDNLAGTHQALVNHAIEGFDPHKAAGNLFDLLHGKAGKGLSNLELQTKMAEITANASPEQLRILAGEYNGLAEQKQAQALLTVFKEAERGKLDDNAEKVQQAYYKATEILASATPEQAYRLEALANRLATKSNSSNLRQILSELEPDDQNRFTDLLAGFDAARIAANLASACKGSGTDIVSLQRNIAWVPDSDPKGPGHSAYTTSQFVAVQDAYAARFGNNADANRAEKLAVEAARLAASSAGQDPDVAEAAARVAHRGSDQASLLSLLRGEEKFGETRDHIEAAFARQAPSSANPDFATDVGRVDPGFKRLTAATYFGFDAAVGAAGLKDELSKYDRNNPQHSSARELFRMLEHGSDPKNTAYLSREDQVILFQTHDELNPNTPLRVGLDRKLSGDTRVEALLIYDFGFYASQQADLVHQDINNIGKIVQGYHDQTDLVARIEQTDRKLLERYGKSLEQVVREDTKLSQAEKNDLLVYVYTPRVLTLQNELAQATPNKQLNEGRLSELVGADPAFVEAYNTFSPNTGLYKDLENAAIAGKVTWEVVAWQEARVSGIPARVINAMAFGNYQVVSPEQVKLAEDLAQQNGLPKDRLPILSTDEMLLMTPYALLPATGKLYMEINAAQPRADKIGGYIADPMQAEIYQRLFEADLVGQLETLAAANKIDRSVVAKQELKLNGLSPDTLNKIEQQTNPNSVEIGNETSVLRGMSPTQLQLSERMFNYVADGRAIEAGLTTYASLQDILAGLHNDGKMETRQLVRAAMLLDGVDPWNKAAAIKKDPLVVIPELAPLREEYRFEVAELYRLDSGKGIIHTVLHEPDLLSRFTSEADKKEWLGAAIDTLHSRAVLAQVRALDQAVRDIGDPQATPEKRSAAAASFITVMEEASRAGTNAEVKDLYDGLFSKDTRGQFTKDVGDIWAKYKLLTTDQRDYVMSLADGSKKAP